MGKRLVHVLLVLLAYCACVSAKDKPLVAIVLYSSDAGPAYVQLSGFAINGASALAVCSGDKLDANLYKRLGRVPLTPGAVLERNSDGALILKVGASSTCVLPLNLRLEKNRSYSLKEAVNPSVITGVAASKSSNVGATLPTSISPAMQIYIVEAPDTDLAEFLRADRAPAIALWEDYLKQHANSSRAAEARKSLEALLIAQGKNDLAAYRSSLLGGNPAYERLKAARLNSGKALKLIPGGGGEKLRLDVETEFQAIVTTARTELNTYLKTLNEQSAGGYAHLRNAQAQMDHALDVDPSYAGADKLKADINAQKQALDNDLARADSMVAQKNYDQAYAAVARYKSFAGEVPRIPAIIEAAFTYHRDRGRQASKDGKWDVAIAEFKRALEYRTDADTAKALKRAQAELENVRNADAMQNALNAARARVLARQFVEAYQGLECLPEAQRTALVRAEMEKMRGEYVADLTRRANQLYRLHVPLRGPGDEEGARQAHDFLSRVAKLSDDEGTRVKLDLLSDQITAYYLRRAKRSLEKPRSSGVALGWLFLKEAERYKPDHEETRNQLIRYAPEYETRGRPSLGIRFRDQTSRRENRSFADQLVSATITGLENSGLPGLKTFSVGEEADTASGPFLANFFVIGNISQHRVEKNIEQTSVTSHYREGSHDVKNPAWQEARRTRDELETQLDKARQEYDVALGRAHNDARKKEVVAAKAKLDALTGQFTAARKKLDELPETKLEPIIQPYNYTKKRYQLNAVTEVSFRLMDAALQTPLATDSIKVELPKNIVVLENVKPEDVDGIIAQGTPPDEGQLLSEAEARVQQTLVKKLTEQLGALAPKILAQARESAARGDLEGAAEKYVLYLNSTVAKDTPERSEAQEFLRKQFNVGAGITR